MKTNKIEDKYHLSTKFIKSTHTTTSFHQKKIKNELANKMIEQRPVKMHKIKGVQSMKQILALNYHNTHNLQSLQQKQSIHNNRDKFKVNSYNDIKRKRLIRQQKQKSRQSTLSSKKILILPKKQYQSKIQTRISQQNRDLFNSSQKLENLQKQEKQIKQYIQKLQKILVSINTQKQRTQRKPVIQIESQLKKTRINQSQSNEQLSAINQQKYKINKYIKERSTSKKNYLSQQNFLLNSNNFKNTLTSKQLHSSLISQIINKTKQQKKVLNFKEVRNRYKEQLSASKNDRQDTQSRKKMMTLQTENKIQTKKLENLKYQNNLVKNRNRRKILKVYNPFILNKMQQDQNNKLRNQKIQSGLKLENQTIIEEQNSNIQLSDFSSPFNLKKTSQFGQDDKLNLDFSEINDKKNQSSFISSDEPRQLIQKLNQNIIDQRKNRVLDILDLDTGEFKNIIKPKQKKRKSDIQKWKKNFPVGFFQDSKKI